MGLFGSDKAKRIVAKEYGRNSFLALAVLPIALALGRQGMESRREAQAREMEKDAAEMLKRGYRIVSTQEYRLPLLSISYLKVTYEVMDARKQEVRFR
jgi:hypothetical protein